MPKTLIQDIVKKKTVVEKPVYRSDAREKAKPKEKKHIKLPNFRRPRVSFPFFKKICSASKLKFMAGFVAFGILVAIGIIFVNKISAITVEITPKQQFVETDDIFSASTNPQKTELPLEVMQLNRVEKGSIVPTGKKQINRKASGQIVIYNAFSSDSQALIASTRFETPEGKIFRIDKTIVVPGTKVVEGKIVAGEKEVTVFADKPGEEYNIGLSDFTIPGFKDSVKYEKIYGRSKTEMKGGFVGEISVITQIDIDNLRSALKGKVSNYFSEIAKNPKPEDFLLYDNARQIIFNVEGNIPKVGDESDSLELEESATFYGFLLKKADLSRLLAEKYFDAETSSQVELTNSDELDFELKNFTSSDITFGIKGQAHFAWKIDQDQFKKDLVANKGASESFFLKYPAIDKAKIIFKPSWWQLMPKNPDKITIRLILTQKP